MSNNIGINDRYQVLVLVSVKDIVTMSIIVCSFISFFGRSSGGVVGRTVSTHSSNFCSAPLGLFSFGAVVSKI